MKTLTVSLIVVIAVAGGAIAFSTVYDQRARADAGARIDPGQMMVNAKNLPVAHYEDYSVVFN